MQGDFTRSLVNDPPTHVWTRQLKVSAPECHALRTRVTDAPRPRPRSLQGYRTRPPCTSEASASVPVPGSEPPSLHVSRYESWRTCPPGENKTNPPCFPPESRLVSYSSFSNIERSLARHSGPLRPPLAPCCFSRRLRDRCREPRVDCGGVLRRYLIWIGSEQEKTFGPTISGLIHKHIPPERMCLWDSKARGASAISLVHIVTIAHARY